MLLNFSRSGSGPESVVSQETNRERKAIERTENAKDFMRQIDECGKSLGVLKDHFITRLNRNSGNNGIIDHIGNRAGSLEIHNSKPTDS